MRGPEDRPRQDDPPARDSERKLTGRDALGLDDVIDDPHADPETDDELHYFETDAERGNPMP